VFRWKYRCEACKKIFCSDCRKLKVNLPPEIYGFGMSTTQKTGIVCNQCFSLFTLFRTKEKEIKKKEIEKKENK
jgi:rRNA maturation endonuclease Nob1